jgi:hypothetical protein
MKRRVLYALETDTRNTVLIDPSKVVLAKPSGRGTSVLTLDGGIKVRIDATVTEVDDALTTPNAEWIGNGDTGFTMVWDMAVENIARSQS